MKNRARYEGVHSSRLSAAKIHPYPAGKFQLADVQRRRCTGDSKPALVDRVVSDNGSPLPSWISRLTDGEVLIDRSAVLETLALRVVAQRESGDPLVRYVEIDTMTGQIREKQQAGMRGPVFRAP